MATANNTDTAYYKLPMDKEYDKDIVEWIGQFKKGKRAEMVRLAIRYYMANEGTSYSFPNTSKAPEPEVKVATLDQGVKNRAERKVPNLSRSALINPNVE